MKKFLFFSSVIVTCLCCLVSCGGTDDYIPSETSNTSNTTESKTESEKDEAGRDRDAIYASAKASQLQKHEEGDGFNIVIMGDGFTQEDIDNGTYSTFIQKAYDALFQKEPMRSLKKYCDIYQVVVPSTHSGIDYTKHNTAFGTQMESENSTSVYGDSVLVQTCAAKALGLTNASTSDYINSVFDKTLAIVLLNTKGYCGVTLLAANDNVTDSIPEGFSLAYVPANPTVPEYKGDDLFVRLIQHEAVGHGIGKLADEYFYSEKATADNISNFKTGQKIGFYMNTHYDATPMLQEKNPYAIYNKTVKLYAHSIETSSTIYPFVDDPRYTAEELKWYQGGYTFIDNFYRPTLYSLMNSSTDSHCSDFNAPSRLMIYKRIMRAAKGSAFTCNIRSTADFEAFATFDAPGRITSANTAKGAVSVEEAISSPTLPHLHRPVLFEISK